MARLNLTCAEQARGLRYSRPEVCATENERNGVSEERRNLVLQAKDPDLRLL